MAYQPQPGTIAYRAVEWLKTKPKGSEVTASVWAEAIGTDGSTLIGCLATAVSSGLVRRRQQSDNKRLVWWSMGDGQEQKPEPEVLPHRNVAPDVKPQPGAMFPGVRGDEPVERSGGGNVWNSTAIVPVTGWMADAPAPAPAPAKPAPFDCWLSGVSGELVLQGVTANEDGDSVLTREQVTAVRMLLGGMA